MSKDYLLELKDCDKNDIGSLIITYHELKNISDMVFFQLDELEKNIKDKMKEKKWDNYKDEQSKISVSLSTSQVETVNKKALKLLLNSEQYNQVVTKKSKQKLIIITEKDRERLNKYGTKK